MFLWKSDLPNNLLLSHKSFVILAGFMSFNLGSTLYEHLGVPEEVTFANLGKAFKKLSKEWNPDTCAPNRRASAGEVSQTIANAHNILGNPAGRSAYDRQLKEERRRAQSNHLREHAKEKKEKSKREREEAKELAVEHNKKRKDGLKSKVLTVYWGLQFTDALMIGKPSVGNWTKAQHVTCIGTMATSFEQMADRGLFTLLSEQFDRVLCDASGISTTAVLFTSVGAAGKSLYTAQNLSHNGDYTVATVEQELQVYLAAQLTTSNTASLVVFGSRRGSITANIVSSPQEINAQTLYQVVFGGILHRGRWFVDNRTNKTTQTTSDYGTVLSHTGPISVASLTVLVAEEAKKREKTFSATTHTVQLVTGNIENLSRTTKTVQNYRLCKDFSDDDTLLETGPMVRVVGVFARAQTDIGVANAGGSRTFYTNAALQMSNKIDVVTGLSYQMQVLYRQDKIPPCMGHIRVVDNAPQVLGRTLQLFLTEVVNSLPSANIDSKQ